MKNKILIKVSGDLVTCPQVIEDIESLASNPDNHITLVYGFGTRLSEELARQGIPFQYKNGIRETTSEGLKVALKVSEEVRKSLEARLGKYANISYFSPVKKEKGKITNTNADDIILQHFSEYQSIIVYSLQGRNKSKLSHISHLETRFIRH